MRHYELVTILSPMLNQDQAAEAWGRIKDFIANRDGEIVREQSWGTRRLAYPIRKGSYNFLEGNYYLTLFSTEQSFNRELETFLRLDERILRSLVIATEPPPPAPPTPPQPPVQAEVAAPAAEEAAEAQEAPVAEAAPPASPEVGVDTGVAEETTAEAPPVVETEVVEEPTVAQETTAEEPAAPVEAEQEEEAAPDEGRPQA